MKLEQIRPTFLRIDELIKTLLAAGGNAEFEKVRKLTGMVLELIDIETNDWCSTRGSGSKHLFY
jgi:hypothetical protein